MENPTQHSREALMKWIRISNGSIICGVCTGLARQFQSEVWLIRMLWILFAVFTAGLAVPLYLACWIAFPMISNLSLCTSLELKTLNKKRVLGVCLRLHQRGDIELGLGRLVALVLLFATGGAFFLVYLLLHLVLEFKAENVDS